MVRAGELGASGLEAAAGDKGWGRCGAESSTGEHLGQLVKVSIGTELEHTLAVLWRGDVAELSSRWFDESSFPTHTHMSWQKRSVRATFLIAPIAIPRHSVA